MAVTHKHVSGAGALSEVLQAIPRELRAGILSKAVGHAVEPIKVAAKRFARRSRDTGSLHASIDKVVRNYPNEAVAVGMVGPTKDYFDGKKKLAASEIRRGAEQPSRRAHLIEFGHMQVVGKGKNRGRVVGWVPPRPFLRPAVMTTQNEVAARLLQGVEKGIEATRAKLVRSGAHKS